MDNFIFVCYEHGAGGENLSLKISSLDICQQLQYEKHSSRTWTYDCFNKLFLKEYDPEWKNKIKPLEDSSQYKVVPSHYKPEILRELFPNSIYVVINSPKTQKYINTLIKNIYKKVWLNKHKTLTQKIGYFKQNSKLSPTREQLKLLSSDINNGEIQCIINKLLPNKINSKKIFRKFHYKYTPKFSYVDQSKLFTIPYQDVVEKNINWLLSRLTKFCIDSKI